MTLQIALTTAGTERDVFKTTLAGGRRHDRFAATIAQHEIDEMGILPRAVCVMTGGARRLLVGNVLLVREGAGLVVQEKVAVVALVTQRKILV